MASRKRRQRKFQTMTLFEGVVVGTCIFFWVVLVWTVMVRPLWP